MGNEEAVDTGVKETTFSPLDDLIKDLDGPDLDGDLAEGEVTTKAEDEEDDKPAEDDKSQKAENDDSASEDADDADAGEDKGEGADGEESEDADAGEADVADPKDLEIKNLRAATRTLTKDLRELRRSYDTLNKRIDESGLAPDKEEESSVEAEAIEDAMRIKLETIAETMKLTPQFADLDDVVTEDRYNETIEGAVAKLVSDGYEENEAFDLANNYVWSRPNPYKYLYELIKGGHPDFADSKDAGDKDEKKTDEGKKKETKKAEKNVAPSIDKAPGGGNKDKGGWTTARIDDLPEDKLSDVPPDIYDKYMKGELD